MTTNETSLAGTSATLAQPDQFSASALSASLTVKDVQKSRSWYRDVLGFAIDREMEHEGTLRAVAVRAGGVRLMLNQDDGGRGWERTKGEGFSLHFTTSQNVDEIAARIKAAGGTLVTEPADMPWGARVFRIEDPDGYRLSVASPL
jgi:lactoylglutathione lyase